MSTQNHYKYIHIDIELHIRVYALNCINNVDFAFHIAYAVH